MDLDQPVQMEQPNLPVLMEINQFAKMELCWEGNQQVVEGVMMDLDLPVQMEQLNLHVLMEIYLYVLMELSLDL